MWICILVQFSLAVCKGAIRAIPADLALQDVPAPLSLWNVLLVVGGLLNTTKVLLLLLLLAQRAGMI